MLEKIGTVIKKIIRKRTYTYSIYWEKPVFKGTHAVQTRSRVSCIMNRFRVSNYFATTSFLMTATLHCFER